MSRRSLLKDDRIGTRCYYFERATHLLVRKHGMPYSISHQERQKRICTYEKGTDVQIFYDNTDIFSLGVICTNVPDGRNCLTEKELK